MKSVLRLYLVSLITLAFAGMSFAQAQPTTPPKGEKPKATRITGELVSLDAKAGTLTVKVKDKEMSFTTGTKAKSALQKVKVGDTVRVSYTEKDGKLIASSVAHAKGMAKQAEKKDGTKTGTK